MEKQELVCRQLQADFRQTYQNQHSCSIYFAPGRVNLIGEHTDYNGGAVLPCALTMGTYGVIAKNNKKVIRLFSNNYPQAGMITIPLEPIKFYKQGEWVDYVKSIIWILEKEDIRMKEGYDILYYGTLPSQSGLSSSASIEVLTLHMLLKELGYFFSGEKMALLSQKAENEYMNVQCGIMDQFSICMGRKDHAIFLNTSTMQYRYAPVDLGEYQLMIAQSNKKRSLVESDYNKRRMECENALREIKKVRDVHFLCQLSMTDFEELQYRISDPLLRRRAFHVVSENQRTIDAFESLCKGNIREFGMKMNESHRSLRDQYEVTGRELDLLVETAWEQKGVIGARMTGAGFGGCTINLIQKGNEESFIYEVGKKYLEETGLNAEFYKVGIGDGPQQISGKAN